MNIYVDIRTKFDKIIRVSIPLVFVSKIHKNGIRYCRIEFLNHFDKSRYSRVILKFCQFYVKRRKKLSKLKADIISVARGGYLYET